MKIKALSLFSGVGGGDIALEWAGCEIVGMCEVDSYCQSVLKQSFPHTRLYSDIRDMNPEDIGDVDILLTTFPCQPVSVAGKQRGDKDDRWLWRENLKFIRSNKPIFVIGENVKGLLRKGLQGVEDDLREEGYQVRSYVLAAKDIGAIHQRERVFIIGYKERRQITYTTSNGCNGQQKRRGYPQTNEWTEEGQDETKCPEGCSEVRSILQSKLPTESWRTLPQFSGVVNGFPQKLDKIEKQRLKALGNAVMPQQIYPFIKSCVEILKREL